MKKIIITMLLLTGLALAHGGRANSAGCHTNHKTEDYHCH